MTSVGALLLTAASALVSLIAGRVFVGGLGADLLRRFGPVDAAGSNLPELRTDAFAIGTTR